MTGAAIDAAGQEPDLRVTDARCRYETEHARGAVLGRNHSCPPLIGCGC